MSDKILFFSTSRLSLLLASPTLAAYSKKKKTAREPINFRLLRSKSGLSTHLIFIKIELLNFLQGDLVRNIYTFP